MTTKTTTPLLVDTPLSTTAKLSSAEDDVVNIFQKQLFNLINMLFPLLRRSLAPAFQTTNRSINLFYYRSAHGSALQKTLMLRTREASPSLLTSSFFSRRSTFHPTVAAPQDEYDRILKEMPFSQRSSRRTSGPSIGEVRLNKYDSSRFQRYNGKQWHRKCADSECAKQPSFGSKEDGIPRFCVTHKGENDVDVVSKRCAELGCNTQASYGSAEDGIRHFCAKHKRLSDVDVSGQKCVAPGCDTCASFGKEEDGILIPRFCAKHKGENDVDSRNPKCADPECTIQPSFGNEKDGIARFCAKHKGKNDVDVRSPKCADPECTKQPIFGSEEDGIARFCAKHKGENDVDVKNPKCGDPECTKQPHFGSAEDRRKMFCVKHKDKNHIYIK